MGVGVPMLKRLACIFLCFTFSYSTLGANSEWNPPTISSDPSDVGHIFRKSDGHLAVDTPENRAFIESAAASRDNRAGTTSFGVDIYLKTMPDGSQAWQKSEKTQ